MEGWEKHRKFVFFSSGANREGQSWVGSCDPGKYLLNQRFQSTNP